MAQPRGRPPAALAALAALSGRVKAQPRGVASSSRRGGSQASGRSVGVHAPLAACMARRRVAGEAASLHTNSSHLHSAHRRASGRCSRVPHRHPDHSTLALTSRTSAARSQLAAITSRLQRPAHVVHRLRRCASRCVHRSRALSPHCRLSAPGDSHRAGRGCAAALRRTRCRSAASRHPQRHWRPSDVAHHSLDSAVGVEKELQSMTLSPPPSASGSGSGSAGAGAGGK